MPCRRSPTQKNNYLRDGFLAKTRDEEIKCLDLELNVLMSIEDVTDRGERRRQAGHGRRPRPFTAAERSSPNIEKESLDEDRPAQRRRHALPGRPVPPLSLQEVHRHAPRLRARDSRLRSSAATRTISSIPRYDLDVAFFRVYENDKPVKSEHYLKWSKDGCEGRRTRLRLGAPRQDQPAQHGRRNSKYLRDTGYPYVLQSAEPARKCCSMSYSGRSDENARRAKMNSSAYQNSRKARLGGLGGLAGPGHHGPQEEGRGSDCAAR